MANENNNVVIDRAQSHWSDLWKKEDYWAIWLGFVLLIAAICIFINGAPASYKETIDNSNAIMKAEAEKAPFKTIAYIQAQDAKKGVVGTSLPIAKEIKAFIASPGKWTNNPLKSMFTSQAEADAKNAANKEKAEAAKAKAESSFAAAEAAEKAASSGPVWGEMETGDLSSRTCTSCGAELVCGPETAATTCPYCGNPTVLGGQLSGKLKPEYIIPFRMDKKTAIENLKKYYKGKAFLPKAFKESNHIEEIQGVYVPFWLYDGRMEARGAYKAEISESHREGDYIVTTTRHFDVARVGDADFVRVPVDGSSKMPDAHMDAIEPFDYSDLKPFSTAYLPGFLADRYDEDDKKCAARVLTRMKNSTAAALHDTLGGYTGVQTLSEQLDPRTLEPHYALLPVWMLHTRWKEQDFLFAMNGQTGKLIGDLPVDKGRVAAWFAGISIPLMILTALIMLL